MYDLNAIHIFIKVVEHEGFTAAATNLGVAKSKVSRVISKLEKELQTLLLERSTRHIRLTAAGQLFYQYAQRIQDEAMQAESAMQVMNEQAKGVLRVSTSLSIGQFWLKDKLADFLRLYPDIELNLEMSNRRVDLIEENFDVVLRLGELPDSSLVAKRIGMVALQLFASEQYIQQFGFPLKTTDLKNHRLICMSNAVKNDRLVLNDAQGEQETMQLNFFAKINDFGTIHQLAKDGMGIAMLPDYMCKKQTGLINVLPQWEINRIPLQIVYPSHRGVTPKLKAFIDFIQGTFD